jgi:hypothetical protein
MKSNNFFCAKEIITATERESLARREKLDNCI